MGHFIFICLHIAVLAFFIPGLIVTIPLHIIYATQKGKAEREKIRLKNELARERKSKKEEELQEAVKRELEKLGVGEKQTEG